jgi:hypothetical protein
MELASVRPDDIVRVDKKGRVFEAFVLGKRRGGLEIAPLQRGISYTTASAREVICHWAKRGGPRRRSRPGSGRSPAEPGGS